MSSLAVRLLVDESCTGNKRMRLLALLFLCNRRRMMEFMGLSSSHAQLVKLMMREVQLLYTGLGLMSFQQYGVVISFQASCV